ncbi:MAG: DUF2811 domain-containing protein [Vulcanococcus sp.]
MDRDTAETRAELNPPADARDHLQRCLQQRASEEEARAARVSLEAEVPEVLFEGMRSFLQSRPDWDQYRVITSALAGFLFQNGCGDRCVAQHYLNGLFMRAGE